MVDGGSGLEQALDALWGDVPTTHTVEASTAICLKMRQRLHEEVSADATK